MTSSLPEWGHNGDNGDMGLVLKHNRELVPILSAELTRKRDTIDRPEIEFL